MKFELDNEMLEMVFEMGVQAYEKMEYDKSFKALNQLANLGHEESKYIIGEMYIYGKGIEQDFDMAKKYFMDLSDTCNVNALNNLGAICCQQDNYKEAIIWFEKASKLDSKEANNNLGIIYENGLAAKKDMDLAINYYNKAALLGDKDAKNRLVELLEANEITNEQREYVDEIINILKNTGDVPDIEQIMKEFKDSFKDIIN